MANVRIVLLMLFNLRLAPIDVRAARAKAVITAGLAEGRTLPCAEPVVVHQVSARPVMTLS